MRSALDLLNDIDCTVVTHGEQLKAVVEALVEEVNPSFHVRRGAALALVARDANERLSTMVDTGLKAILDAASDTPSNSRQASFDPTKLSIRDLWDLHAGLKTVFDVMSGILSEPRFAGRGSHMSPAGRVIENLWNNFADDLKCITEAMAGRTPTTDSEHEKKFALMIGEFTDGLCSVQVAAEGIAKTAASLTRIAPAA